MNDTHENANRMTLISRRHALRNMSAGFGYLALAALAAEQSKAGESSLKSRAPHFEPRAKRVIFLCMRGGPSHVDTFDYKPRLATDHGRPSSYGTPWWKSSFRFNQHGESGLWISELFPNLAKQVDNLCLLNGMHCDQPSHAQAMLQLHTGNFQQVRPSMGAWALYGLGTENQNLPGFISINPPSSVGGAQNFGSAFLPAAFQGTKFTVTDTSARNRRIDRMRRGEVNPNGINNAVNERLSKTDQRAQLDLLAKLNREKLTQDARNPVIEGALENYELAFRMQDAVPAVMDTSGETSDTLELYGIGEDPTDGFGRQCLLARRFAEAGVRFIELGHGSWDQHSNLQTALAENCAETDKPIAGLIADLKGRIIDQAADSALQVDGVDGVLVNIGGDIRAAGDASVPVWIRSPQEQTTAIATVELRKRAIATSGSYEQFFEIGGQRFSHIIDPRTARPAGHSISVSVIAPTATAADALATALNVMTIEDALQWCESHEEFDCLIVDSLGKQYRSAGWPTEKKLDESIRLVSTGLQQWDPDAKLTVSFEVNRQSTTRYRRPYVAVWVEDADGFPVRTLVLWLQEGRGARWHRDLKRWYKQDRVRQLVDGSKLIGTVSAATRPPGRYKAVWDGKDDQGKPVAKGEFTLYIEAAREHGTYQLIRQSLTLGTKAQEGNLKGNEEIKTARFVYQP